MLTEYQPGARAPADSFLSKLESHSFLTMLYSEIRTIGAKEPPENSRNSTPERRGAKM